MQINAAEVASLRKMGTEAKSLLGKITAAHPEIKTPLKVGGGRQGIKAVFHTPEGGQTKLLGAAADEFKLSGDNVTLEVLPQHINALELAAQPHGVINEQNAPEIKAAIEHVADLAAWHPQALHNLQQPERLGIRNDAFGLQAKVFQHDAEHILPADYHKNVAGHRSFSPAHGDAHFDIRTALTDASAKGQAHEFIATAAPNPSYGGLSKSNRDLLLDPLQITRTHGETPEVAGNFLKQTVQRLSQKPHLFSSETAGGLQETAGKFTKQSEAVWAADARGKAELRKIDERLGGPPTR
jgi:hypothetical protein